MTLAVVVGETLVVGLTDVDGLAVGGDDFGGGEDFALTITCPHIAQFANDVSEPWRLQRYVNVPSWVNV